MMKSSEAPISPEPFWNVRTKGLAKLVVGSGLFAAAILIAYRLKVRGTELSPKAGILLALPGALALAGLLESATGVPFSQFSSKWDSLKGWQRGLIGSAVAVLAFLIVIAIILAYVENVT